MDDKIKVFISSNCDKRYIPIRSQLKRKIESTGIAEVYIFEEEGASTLSAEEHYRFALKDSDVCIFLIDNGDTINKGVLNEAETVKKHNIKSLYYFSDERKKEKTGFEISLIGAKNSKIKTVHSFQELCDRSAKDLIDDIVKIYHYYCKGDIAPISFESSIDEISKIDVSSINNIVNPSIQKCIIKNVDKCKKYITEFAIDRKISKINNEEKSSEIDAWGLEFLKILFENKSIKTFNTSMFIECLKSQQNNDYNDIVSLRWKAIEFYFLGDLEKSIENLNSAKELAKRVSAPNWVIKDILIDLRNLNIKLDNSKNIFTESIAQKELNDSNEEVFYPALDRVLESLNEKYIKGLFENKTKSPFSITIGNALCPYVDLISSSYIISIFNGSLTHILLLYDRVTDLLFYLSNKYDDWSFRLNMFKLAIFNGKEKNIKNLKNSYPEILNNLNSEEALSIMKFCENHPVGYEKLNSLLLGFGAVGYYLDNKTFRVYLELLIFQVKKWIEDERKVLSVGFNIFRCIKEVYIRLDQDLIVNFYNSFFDNKCYYFYREMFNSFCITVDISKLSENVAESFITNICNSFRDKIAFDIINTSSHSFLWQIRKQSAELTKELDKVVKEYLPEFYEGEYTLETTDNEEEENPKQIKKYLQDIKHNNKTQGLNGTYYGYVIRPIETISNIMLNSEHRLDDELLCDIVDTVIETILKSKEKMVEKINAVSLLLLIAIRYPHIYELKKSKYDFLNKNQDDIDDSSFSMFEKNLSIYSLKICLQIMFSIIDNKTESYQKIIEMLPSIENDIPNTTKITNEIVRFFEIDEVLQLPDKVESVVLQCVLQWLNSESIDVRWNATRILFALAKNPINETIVNNQLIRLIDSDNVYIKNLVLNNIFKCKGISDSTKDYIVSKCKTDCNYVVRLVCDEKFAKYS